MLIRRLLPPQVAARSDGEINPTIPVARTVAGKTAIFLRDGDVIPAQIVKIDERGVSFKTDLSAGGFVPNEKVKAVDLVTGALAVVQIDKAKRERLLTLPRMQRENPPTHMIRSKTGDYLRGRVITMDDKSLEVEIRLDVKTIPRDRLSRIIWLHADELDPSKKLPDPEPAAPPPPRRRGPSRRRRAPASRRSGRTASD